MNSLNVDKVHQMTRIIRFQFSHVLYGMSPDGITKRNTYFYVFSIVMIYLKKLVFIDFLAFNEKLYVIALLVFGIFELLATVV